MANMLKSDTTSDQASSRRKLILAALILVPIVAFVAVYFLFFTGDSADRLSLSNPATTTAGAGQTDAQPPTASALTGTWSVASGSTVGYRVREQLARLPAQSDAVGRTEAVTGSFRLSQEGGQWVVAQGARFEADVTKLTSDESRRDERIRTQGLESSRFPTATFVTTAPIRLPAGTESGGPVKASVTGDLTIHGVTKSVSIPLEAQVNGGRIEIVGSHTFPFSDFGMSPPNIAGFVTVDDDVTLEFKLLLDRT